VKILTNSADSPKQFAEKIKFFSALKSIQISVFFFTQSLLQSQDKQENFFLGKACQNMRRIQSLKDLVVKPISKGSNAYLPWLNKTQKVLDSLKALKIYFDWKGANEAESLELMKKSKNLLRNVTSLHLSTLYSPFHFESFQKLGELCSKVSTLSFEFSSREVIYDMFGPRRFSDQRLEIKTNYLQTLKAFQQLKVLSLEIADIFTFIKDFALPPSIQSLRLNFSECLSEEIMLKIDMDFTGSESSEEELSQLFEENNLLAQFYDNFKELESLETLELFFALDSNQKTYKYQKCLLHSLLKKMSSPLNSLVILPCAFPGAKDKIPEIQDPCLPQFLESCENFALTLKTLKIGSLKVIYSKFETFTSWNKFKNLSEIEIIANFVHSQGANTETIGSFLENFVLLGESICRIQFSALINCNTESLLSLLKQMNQLKRPNKLHIRLELGLVNSQQESGMSFVDGINELEDNKKCYSKVKGVSLRPLALFTRSDEIKTFIKLYQERFDNSMIE